MTTSSSSSSTSPSVSSSSSSSSGMKAEAVVVDCIIIGAGAAGLQCAADLLSLSNTSDDGRDGGGLDDDVPVSVVVLEGRPFVGGRIRTETLTVATTTSTTTTTTNTASFQRDVGAAWVHGIGNKTPNTSKSNDMTEEEQEAEAEAEGSVNYDKLNPMVELLLERTKVTTPSSLLELGILDPIFVGNPETRPEKVLLRPTRTGGNPAIAMFVDGRQVPIYPPPGSHHHHHRHDEKENEDTSLNTNTAAAATTTTTTTTTTKVNNNVNLTDAVHRHYDLLRKAETVFHDRQRQYQEQGPEPEVVSVQQVVDDVLSVSKENHDEEETLTGFFRFIMTNWYGISLNKMPFEMLLPITQKDDEYIGDEGDYDGPHCKVPDGMITMLDPLLERIHRQRRRRQQGDNGTSNNDGADDHVDYDDTIIQCNQTVVGITDDPVKKRIYVKTQGGTRYEAKHCVCTLPLGCLQYHTKASLSVTDGGEAEEATSKIANNCGDGLFFRPPLDSAKVHAIHSLSSGSYKKVFMTFDAIFWPVEPPSIGLAVSSTDDVPSFPGRYLLLTNVWAKHGIPCLEAALCGDMGSWAFGQSDAEIQDIILHFVGTAMGVPSIIPGHDRGDDGHGDSASPRCTSVSVTRWEEDEYTRGSYTEYKLGTTNDDVDHIKSSAYDGRLLFAGEHTEPEHMGSVHGALMSGTRIAHEVKKSLMTSSE